MKDAAREIRRIARSRLNDAVRVLSHPSATAMDKSIHRARKRLKEVRALHRLLEEGLSSSAFDHDTIALRDAARPLSEMRDASVLLAVLKSLEADLGPESSGITGPLAKMLRRRLADLYQRSRKEKVLPKAASSIRKIRERVRLWEPKGDSLEVAEAGLEKTYKRCRKALAAVRRNASDRKLHTLRKRVKDLRYQLELLGPVWPRQTKTAAAAANKLSELLGDDHDLAVLGELMESEPASTLQRAIDRKRRNLQRSARVLSEKLLADL